MQWLVVRLLLEVSFCGPVVEAFGECHSIQQMLASFESFDELKKRGVVVGVVFAGAAVAETVRAVAHGISLLMSAIRDSMKQVHKNTMRRRQKSARAH